MFARLFSTALLTASVFQGQLTAMPQEFPTRAEVVMSLVLATTPNIPAIKNTNQFADVPKGSWYEAFMLYAQSIGMISANAETKLRPEISVSRAEFLKMIAATFDVKSEYTHNFSDVPSTAWYAQYTGIAKQYRLFILNDSSKLEPQRAITKSEVANAIDVFSKPKEQPNIQLEQVIAQDQARGHLSLYSVISTRTQKVALVDPNAGRTPMVKRVALPPSLPQLREQVLKLVNDIRAESNLLPLSYNSQLEQSAQAYADKMIKEGFFGHTAPDGQVLKDRISATGFYNRAFSLDCNCVKGYALGENLARGPKTAKEAVDAWMKSPDHRAAILSADYTFLGIGVNAGIWVQHFGGIILPN